MIFADTNYFLRFLIDDGSVQHKAAVGFFHGESEKKRSLTTSVLVFFEVFWVLTSSYKKTDLEGVELMQKLLRMAFVRFEEKEVLETALERASLGAITFEDCFNLEWAKSRGIREFATFDKKLLKEWLSPLRI